VEKIEVTNTEFEAVERELLRENYNLSVISKRTGIDISRIPEIIKEIEIAWDNNPPVNISRARTILIGKTRDAEHRLHELRAWLMELHESILKKKEKNKELTIEEAKYFETPLKEVLKIILKIEELILGAQEKTAKLCGLDIEQKLSLTAGTREQELIKLFRKQKELSEGAKTTYSPDEVIKKLSDGEIPAENTKEYEDWIQKTLRGTIQEN